MTNFDALYLRLLRGQVEEEIKYLTSVGHNTHYPTQPCIFCVQMAERLVCNRMRELREFLSQIMVKLNGKIPTEENKTEFTVLAGVELLPFSEIPLLPENPDPF